MSPHLLSSLLRHLDKATPPAQELFVGALQFFLNVFAPSNYDIHLKCIEWGSLISEFAFGKGLPLKMYRVGDH